MLRTMDNLTKLTAALTALAFVLFTICIAWYIGATPTQYVGGMLILIGSPVTARALLADWAAPNNRKDDRNA